MKELIVEWLKKAEGDAGIITSKDPRSFTIIESIF